MALSSSNLDRRILSRPLRVMWAGWESTTVRLQQCGWQLAAEQSVQYAELRIDLRHESFRCFAYSSVLRDFDYYASCISMGRSERDLPPIQIQAFGCDMSITMVGGPSVLEFEPIDAAPQFVSREIASIDDLKWFAAPLARTEEIIVEPQTVAEMLEKIREMQAPEQARLREKQRRQLAREELEAGPRQVFHAQIISLADRRAA